MRKTKDHTLDIKLERPHSLSIRAQKSDLEKITRGITLTGITNEKAKDTKTFPRKHYDVLLGPEEQELFISTEISLRKYIIKFSKAGIKFLENHGYVGVTIPQTKPKGKINAHYDQ